MDVERTAKPSPLVYTTKCASTFSDTRTLRYEMQAAAKYLLPGQRVGICLRHVMDGVGGVDVFKHRATQKAFYGGLMVCGSVWLCPVCAAKISERRRQELKSGFKTNLDSGGHCTMVTLTISHSMVDKLSDLLKALFGAMKHFRSGRKYNEFRKSIKLIGSIRAFEITYGVNGWHPHIHLLLMHEYEIEPWELPDLQEQLYEMWSAACSKHGLYTSCEHGVMLSDAEEADTYIGKWGDLVERTWGIDAEMTKSHIKKGRQGGLTPFDMLRVIVEDGDLQYAVKFREYAMAVKGMRQLVWSPGLKKRFLIEDKNDEQIANEKVEEADLLGVLSLQEWRYILKNNLRAKLLNLAELVGYEEALIQLQIKKESLLSAETTQPILI